MDPGALGPLGDILGGGAGAGAFKILERLFTIRPGDIPVCQTRIVREGRGFPWNRQIAVHPLPDGTLEMKALYEPSPSPEEPDLPKPKKRRQTRKRRTK